MQTSQRAEHNHALEYAVRRDNDLEGRLLAVLKTSPYQLVRLPRCYDPRCYWEALADVRTQVRVGYAHAGLWLDSMRHLKVSRQANRSLIHRSA